MDTGSSPNYDITQFDDIFHSLLTVFQVITLEGWSEILYDLQDGFSSWLSVIYMVLLVMAGGIFAVNLALAVIADSFIALYRQKETKDARPKWLDHSIFVWGRGQRDRLSVEFNHLNSVENREEVEGLGRLRWWLLRLVRNPIFETVRGNNVG